MSIPIPLVLALLSRRNNSRNCNCANKPQSTAMVVQNSKATSSTQNTKHINQNHQIRRPVNNQHMVSRLSSIAGLIGGPPGAKIGRVANVLNTINSINKPMNALSLLSQGNNPANLLNVLSNNRPSSNNKSMPNMSGMFNNINNMLSNIDNDKKEELLTMAKNLMGDISNNN